MRRCNMTLEVKSKKLVCEYKKLVLSTLNAKPLNSLKTCQDLDAINIHQSFIKS